MGLFNKEKYFKSYYQPSFFDFKFLVFVGKKIDSTFLNNEYVEKLMSDYPNSAIVKRDIHLKFYDTENIPWSYDKSIREDGIKYMKKQYDISSTSTVINVSFYESRINEFGENIYVETIPIFESIIPKHEVKQISESLPSMHKDKEFYEFLKRFFMDLINRGYQPKFRFSQEIDISYSDEIYEEKNGYNLIKNGYTISTKTEEISSDYKSRIGIIMPKPSIGHIEKIAISEITIESWINLRLGTLYKVVE